MLKKYKILLLIVALTATGIALILAVWLYGSYRSEREQLVGTAERSLFNVLQNYHQKQSEEQAKADTSDTDHRKGWLLSFVAGVYPSLDLEPMRRSLDSIHAENRQKNKIRRRRGQGEIANEVLPLYLLEKIDFNDTVLTQLEEQLGATLVAAGITIKFELFSQQMKREEWQAYFRANRKDGAILTRPILVNPDKDQFLYARFDKPWGQVVRRLWGQALISLILLSALIGTFVYLFKTIRKQNQLAEQRKAFVNNMTHELKTPVSTVMAAVEAIQRFVNSDDKARMNKYLDLSKGELEHLHNMIERVLQLDVDEDKGIHLLRQPFDLVTLVRNCVDTIIVGTKKTVDVTLEHAMDLLIVHADQGHLKNVVSNLLDNAIKYSADPVEIKVGIYDHGDEVEIRVKDFGKGIAKAHISLIFDMFYRVPEGNLHEVKGFGLGLAYVRQVTLQHGGKVSVSSESGKGSTFVVRIPKMANV